jgi:AraC-like DNA-binding protein
MTDDPPRTWVIDLFGEPSSPQRTGRGRRQHVPTPALQDRVRAMRADGLSIDAIAKAVGLGRSTLFRHYAPELGSASMSCLRLVDADADVAAGFKRLAPGRPRHVPTAALRCLVVNLASQGRSLAAIGAATGLAPQTVKRHYSAELESAAGGGGGSIAGAVGLQTGG